MNAGERDKDAMLAMKLGPDLGARCLVAATKHFPSVWGQWQDASRNQQQTLMGASSWRDVVWKAS